ncbi:MULTISPECIES: hypothetical protein [Micromonospora]|uniref:Uncharacterized protein n=1 Tax=Micromonospora solifontis TaxID=2487138 RepID=A0ABX9WH38_9ACTN|nr:MULTISPECIES: hypothetical protein [Micromonospora]NES16007.1 hypothetical protein [Micromonospora sp. PPF5-17B]NES36572.1 hypothetical protein [Micromonospora solifontis]NES57322.1 hypothetical protein [Micromonospora sp. PPF5-6]RNL99311.1 hypothetical protein EFE23_10435 [Micromonospora solifontis]
MSATTEVTPTTSAPVPAFGGGTVTAVRNTALLALAAGCSVLAGLIHYAVVPEHRTEWVGYAAFFTLLGAFQLIWAAAVWALPRPWLFSLGVVINAAAIALWAVSRTAGLPLGPEAGEPEAVGVIDVLCVIAEAVALTGTVAALWGSVRRRS